MQGIKPLPAVQVLNDRFGIQIDHRGTIVRTPQSIIKIAADDVTELRKVDVFRVLENCDADELQRTAHFIKVNRPELVDEVGNCLTELLAQ